MPRGAHHQQNAVSDFCSLSCVMGSIYVCMAASPPPGLCTLGRETSPPGWRGSWITGFHSSLVGTQETEESRAWPAPHCWSVKHRLRVTTPIHLAFRVSALWSRASGAFHLSYSPPGALNCWSGTLFSRWLTWLLLRLFVCGTAPGAGERV